MKQVYLARYKGKSSLLDPSRIDPTELTFSTPGKNDLIVRVSEFSGCHLIARALLGAFYDEFGSLNFRTLKTHVCHLRHLMRFIISENGSDSVDRLDGQLLRRYLNHMESTGLAVRSRHRSYKVAERLIQNAAKLRGRVVAARYNPVPRAISIGTPTAHLTPIALIRMLAAAKREVREVWDDFERAAGLDKKTPLGKAVALTISQHHGVLPSVSADCVTLREIVKQAGGIEAISRRLHATVSSIIPFVILIAYETVANVEALAEINSECLSPDVLFPTRSIISWDTKRRSRKSQSVSRDKRGQYSAPALIEKVQQLRKRLVPLVDPLYRNRLFLIRAGRSGMASAANTNVVRPLNGDALRDGVATFLKRNNICEEDGSPAKFTLDMLRPSVLAEVYRRTGDLLVVNRLANHVDIATTVRYVIDRATDEMHDNAIAEVQQQLESVVRGLKVAEGPEEQRNEELQVARANDRDCVDPYNGRGAYARKGEGCPTWFFPYTHPGLVVQNSVPAITSVIQQQRQIQAMRVHTAPEWFDRVYQPVLTIILENILPAIDPEVIRKATTRADALPPLPVFVDA